VYRDSTITTPSSYTVRAGSTDRSTGGQLMQVIEITIHPDYSRQTLFYDIAILKLSANLVYGAGVQPVVLPQPGLYVPAPTPTQLSGWGTLIFQGPSTNILQTVIKPMFSMADCQEAYGVANVNPDIQICSGEEGRDACQGDSGGGLIYNNQVIGIVSWGNGCAFAGYPTVYTRVSEFHSWIMSYM
jgi:trypsin